MAFFSKWVRDVVEQEVKKIHRWTRSTHVCFEWSRASVVSCGNGDDVPVSTHESPSRVKDTNEITRGANRPL